MMRRARASSRLPLALAGVAMLAGALWWTRLSAPLRSARRSNSRPACSIATAVCCGLTPRATAAGGCRRQMADVDPRFFDVLFAYEDKRFRAHHGVDVLALVPRRVSARRPRPHPFRRLDADHAGGAAVGAAQRADDRGKTPPDRARGRDRARPDQGRSAVALSRASRLMAAISRAFAPRRWFISARSRAALRCRKRRCSSLCRNRRNGGGPTARTKPRVPRATACSTALPERARCQPTRSRWPRSEPVPAARYAMPMLAPHAADAAIAQSPAEHELRLTIDADLQNNLEDLARERVRTLAAMLGPDISLAILGGG